MLITRLLKHLRFDLSSKRSFEPSVDINSTLVKRMRAGERLPAPQPQPIFPAVHGSSSGSSAPFDPYLALSTQLREHSQQISAEMAEHRQQISAEMAANYQRLEHHLDNDLNHICDSIRYMHTCIGDIYNKFDWSAPTPQGRAQPLPASGPPFPAWVPPSATPPRPTSPEDPDFSRR